MGTVETIITLVFWGGLFVLMAKLFFDMLRK